MTETRPKPKGQIHVLGPAMKHVHLVSRMAQTTGIDLVGATESGDLTQEQWAGMVQACRACNSADTCPAWIEHAQEDSTAPGFCPNRDRFEDLRKRARLPETEEV